MSSERAKKRRLRGLVKSAAITLAIATSLFVVGLFDGEKGIGMLLHQLRDRAAARERIQATRVRAEQREAEAAALRSDPVAIEAAIREDLRLARPGEWVVREEGATSLRNP